MHSVIRRPIATPSTIEVSPTAISANTRRMSDACGAPVMAVVKADGFGLGAVRAARAALSGGASELGTATCGEAIELRRAGIEAPILAWMLHEDAPVQAAIEHGIRLSPASVEQLTAVARIAAERGLVAEVELELETGMHRSGCPAPDWDELFRVASESPSLRVIGLWTHLAGNTPDQYTGPLDRLAEAAERAGRVGLAPRLHAAASLPATIDPRTRLDIVRLGASLFGIEPVPHAPLGLTPVARWETHVSQVRDAAPGDAVGYGLRVLDHHARLALIPVGYADGVPRRASEEGTEPITVTIRGQRFPFIGAISMDQSVIDVGGSDIGPGDRVTLIGDPELGEPALREWAEALGTISQEVLTGLGQRVARTEEAA